jgi:hypothetical protein
MLLYEKKTKPKATIASCGEHPSSCGTPKRWRNINAQYHQPFSTITSRREPWRIKDSPYILPKGNTPKPGINHFINQYSTKSGRTSIRERIGDPDVAARKGTFEHDF